MTTECPGCGNKYTRVGAHWSYKPSHRPDFTTHQKELLTGLMMGDGWVRTTETAEHPMMAVEMITKDYIEYLEKQFGVFSNGISVRDRAAEDGVSDTTYTVRTCSHPWLQTLHEWYRSGSKTFPNDISLTPTVLKTWYVCDGSYRDRQLKIHSGNEYQNTEKVSLLFENSGLPTPHAMRGKERDDGSSTGTITFTVSDSKTLFDYMGEPLPGFEYKWPNHD